MKIQLKGSLLRSNKGQGYGSLFYVVAKFKGLFTTKLEYRSGVKNRINGSRSNKRQGNGNLFCTGLFATELKYRLGWSLEAIEVVKGKERSRAKKASIL